MYYQGNGIYQYLLQHDLCGRYFWTSGNLWTLLYANSDGTPAALCFASRVESEEELTMPPTPEETRAFQTFALLARQAELPLFSIRFVGSGDHSCEKFFFREYHGGEPGRLITPGQLLDWLKDQGLNIQSTTTEKEINNCSSSSFHDWQREHMGKSVIAVDLDLMRVGDGRIDALYELKRSWMSLDRWKPFESDRANYLAQLHLAQRAGADFQVVYNVRRTEPELIDDVSQLKIFSLDRGWPADELKECAIEKFFSQEENV